MRGQLYVSIDANEDAICAAVFLRTGTVLQWPCTLLIGTITRCPLFPCIYILLRLSSKSHNRLPPQPSNWRTLTHLLHLFLRRRHRTPPFVYTGCLRNGKCRKGHSHGNNRLRDTTQKAMLPGLLLLQAASLTLAAAIERPNEDAERVAAMVAEEKPFEPWHSSTGKKTIEPFDTVDDMDRKGLT
ncbi:hypothetical protein LX36DRAFT_498878 [Colletotrichum falcatum]|nr:hypothetical protein LX36DRAFT_498878 [Colletotrichum falcatum]